MADIADIRFRVDTSPLKAAQTELKNLKVAENQVKEAKEQTAKTVDKVNKQQLGAIGKTIQLQRNTTRMELSDLQKKVAGVNRIISLRQKEETALEKRAAAESRAEQQAMTLLGKQASALQRNIRLREKAAAAESRAEQQATALLGKQASDLQRNIRLREKAASVESRAEQQAMTLLGKQASALQKNMRLREKEEEALEKKAVAEARAEQQAMALLGKQASALQKNIRLREKEEEALEKKAVAEARAEQQAMTLLGKQASALQKNIRLREKATAAESRAEQQAMDLLGKQASDLQRKIKLREKAASVESRAEQQTMTLLGKQSSALQRNMRLREKAAKQAEDEIRRTERAYRALEASIDPVAAATRQHEANVETLNNALKQGIITQTQYASQLELLENNHRRVSGALAGNVRDFRRWSQGALQQAGYQVGDFAVQVTNGTSAIQAFGQQGSQLLQIFGPWGAIAGAAVAVTAAFGVTLEKTLFSAKEAKDEIVDLGSALRSVSDISKDFGDDFEDNVVDVFGNASESIRRLAEDIKRLRLDELRRSIQSTVSGLSEEIDYGRIFSEYQQRIDELVKGPRQATLEAAEKEVKETFLDPLGMTVEGVRNLQQVLDEIKLARSAPDLAEAIARARDVAEDIGGPVGNALVDALAGAAEEGNLLGVAIEGSTDSSKELTRSVSSAANEAERFARAMRASQTASLESEERIAILRAQISAARRGAGEAELRGIEAYMSVPTMPAGVPPSESAALDELRLRRMRQAELEARLEAQLSEILSPPTAGGSRRLQRVDMSQMQAPLPVPRDASAALEAYVKSQRESLAMTREQVKIERLMEKIRRDNATVVSRLGDEEIRRAAESLRQMEKLQNAADSYAKTITDSFADILLEGKSFREAFANLLRQISRDIMNEALSPVRKGLSKFIEMGLNAAVGSIGGSTPTELVPTTGAVDTTFTSGFSPTLANGGALSNGRLTAFANGGIVDGPTLFPMANGAGLMGEAGPEAVMPLRRSSNGKLGVEASPTNINVNVQNYGSEKVDVRRRDDGDVDIIVGRAVNAVADAIESGGNRVTTALNNRGNTRTAF